MNIWEALPHQGVVSDVREVRSKSLVIHARLPTLRVSLHLLMVSKVVHVSLVECTSTLAITTGIYDRRYLNGPQGCTYLDGR